MQSALRDDALATTETGFSVRVGLPWIRSMPLACVREPAVTIDGELIEGLRISVGGTLLHAEQLLGETGWWFAQDRVVLVGERELAPGTHDVVVTFRLLVPYLMAGPGGTPLELPMRVARSLELDHPVVANVSRDAA